MKAIGFLICSVALFAGYNSNAQILNGGQSTPSGAVVYSLPSTTISLKVTAEHESFVAGPFAKYAQKYLGIDANTESGDTYVISSIEMIPYIEADPSVRVAVNLGTSKNASANFLNFCSQGLVITSDSYTGKPANWRFPSVAGAEQFASSGVASNLDNRTTTLYKTVKTAAGLEKVPVQQTQVVEKSIEKKAEETAAMIFRLRQKRLDIITGDTDATYSGEAMDAAIKEITRLEQEYLSLFTGKSIKDNQTVVFDVVPKADNANQLYIAFRISDTQGLVPATNMGGRPIVLELQSEAGEKGASEGVSSASGRVYYRTPATMLAKVIDGQKVLLQARIPVYQLGEVRSFPVNLPVK